MKGLVLDTLVAGRRAFRLPPVSLSALPGTKVALLGPNGGGKTTLLKTVAGLIPARGGSAAVDGRDIPSARPADRAALVAFLPPPGEVEAAFPAEHVVALGRLSRRAWPADLTREDREAASAALDALGIEALARRRFDRLSSGQRQLVLVARTLVQDARICLLDEPSATLDPAHRARVFGAIDRLAARGAVVLYSTHEPGEARRADTCVTVGEEVRVGPPADLLTPERLARLYRAELSSCPTCGRVG